MKIGLLKKWTIDKHTVHGGGPFVPGGSGGGPGNGGKFGREGLWVICGGGVSIFGGGKWKGFGGCANTKQKKKHRNEKREEMMFFKFYKLFRLEHEMHNNVDSLRHEEKRIWDYSHVFVLPLLQILDHYL